MLTRTYIDANVFIYAIGGESDHREPCRAVLRAVAGRRLNGETSTYTLQEIARQRRRRGDKQATTRARDAAALCVALHPVDWKIASDALDLVDRHPALDISDAVHVATALTHGVTTLISADGGFDRVSGIERIDPLDGDRLAALTSE